MSNDKMLNYGESLRVFCERHDTYRARYTNGRPLLNDQCPLCVIEDLTGAVRDSDDLKYCKPQYSAKHGEDCMCAQCSARYGS